MRKILVIAAAITALLAASCSQYRYETVKGDPLGTKIYTLDNGLKIYMSVNKETPRIQTYIAVRVGGKNDPAEATGMAHYFEHLMFKGTEQFGTSDYAAEKPMLDEIEQLFETYRHTSNEAERVAIYHRIDSISYEASKLSIPNEYDKLMATIGAKGTNAFTSTDVTAYTEDIPSNQIESWAQIQADRFRNAVVRGFHTELETIYEEKNMSLTNDSRKVWEAMAQAHFKNHPYGTQTVLGTQEHLKNPSITLVKKYHDTYYVPNNMAICLSGDFDPDYMVSIIEKYFGDMEPNTELPEFTFEPEEPITEPVRMDVYGQDSEFIVLGWRYPGQKSDDYIVADVVSSILSNGKAGLIDLNIVQAQKALNAYSFGYTRPDYGEFMAGGYPKEGQSLDDVKDLLLEQFAKLRAGEFDESLLEGTVNNMRYDKMKELESNSNRAMLYVDSFISGNEWSEDVKFLDKIAAITKDDVVAFANKYLTDESCAIVYKHTGEDKSVQKISAPPITPIMANRDAKSDFLAEIQAREVKPIEPSFLDFSKEISKVSIDGTDMLYTKNKLNETAQVNIVYNTGLLDNPYLSLALDYLEYLGTPEMTAEQYAAEMYQIACSASARCSINQTSFIFKGMEENIGRAMELFEDRMLNAVADEAILDNLKSDILKSRENSKLNQSACFNQLSKYMIYGPEFIKNTTLTNEALEAVTSEQLLAYARELFNCGHEILYYGASGLKDAEALVRKSHKKGSELRPLELRFPESMPTEKSVVYLSQYNANQIRYYQYSNTGCGFDREADPYLTLYNEYFGGGMNAIVFQEMREARGLAYSAAASLSSPSYKGDTYKYFAFIATQNDKMKTAIEAFDEIINQMPESEQAFQVAKEALTGNLRTSRTTGEAILESYITARLLGLDEPRARHIYEVAQNLTLEDITSAQQKWVKDRKYCYSILGDIKDLDMDYLRTLGEVVVLSQEDIFGY